MQIVREKKGKKTEAEEKEDCAKTRMLLQIDRNEILHLLQATVAESTVVPSNMVR